MVYLTAEANRKAKVLGISEKDMSKLYRTAKSLNKFQIDFKKNLESNKELEDEADIDLELEEEQEDYEEEE